MLQLIHSENRADINRIKKNHRREFERATVHKNFVRRFCNGQPGIAVSIAIIFSLTANHFPITSKKLIPTPSTRV